MIRKTLLDVVGGPGGAGFWVSLKAASRGRIFVDRQGKVPEPISSDRVQVLGASATAKTVTGFEDGVTVVANNATNTVTVTLPKISTVGAGFRARVLTGALPAGGAGTTVAPNASDRFQGNGFGAKTAGQTLVNTAASDVIGDYVDVVSDGGTVWYVIHKVGTWA